MLLFDKNFHICILTKKELFFTKEQANLHYPTVPCFHIFLIFRPIEGLFILLIIYGFSVKRSGF